MRVAKRAPASSSVARNCVRWCWPRSWRDSSNSGRIAARRTTEGEAEVRTMPFVDIRVIEGVFTHEEKPEAIRRVSEALLDTWGEGICRATHAVITETPSVREAVAGRTLSAGDVSSEMRSASRARVETERDAALRRPSERHAGVRRVRPHSRRGGSRIHSPRSHRPLRLREAKSRLIFSLTGGKGPDELPEGRR